MKTPPSSSFFCSGRLQLLPSGWWLCAITLFFLLATTTPPVEGLATKRAVYYTDAACTEPSGHVSYAFGNPVANPDGSTTLGPFNECMQVSGGAGGRVSLSAIAVCDVSTGNTGTKSYYGDMGCTTAAGLLVDEEATTVVKAVSTSTTTACTRSFDCLENPAAACWTITECSEHEPSSISPNAFNFLVEEFHDAGCLRPTGKTEIVSAETFNESSSDIPCDGSCYSMAAAGEGEGEGGESSGYGMSECLDDGSLVSQTFGSDDEVCSGEVFDEKVFYSSDEAFSGDFCHTVKINGLYYSRVSCTTYSVSLAPRPSKAFRQSSTNKGSRTKSSEGSRKNNGSWKKGSRNHKHRPGK